MDGLSKEQKRMHAASKLLHQLAVGDYAPDSALAKGSSLIR